MLCVLASLGYSRGLLSWVLPSCIHSHRPCAPTYRAQLNTHCQTHKYAGSCTHTPQVTWGCRGDNKCECNNATHARQYHTQRGRGHAPSHWFGCFGLRRNAEVQPELGQLCLPKIRDFLDLTVHNKDLTFDPEPFGAAFPHSAPSCGLMMKTHSFFPRSFLD